MHPRIIIIGTGFGGLCMAMQLKRAGVDSFTMIEKAGRVGGTWRDNVYPGAACDSPSFAYCFSFEQKTDWSRKWSPQPEILDYIEHCAQKHGLESHIKFHTEIASGRFDAERGVWRLRTTAGETLEAEVVVSAVGQLNRPATPDIEGLAAFEGVQFHSARWDQACDLAGKNVAVVGNAASAVQFVPAIAPEVGRLTIFQRSANWLVPKNDKVYSDREKGLYARFPFLARLYRTWLWLLYESMFPLFRGNERTASFYTRRATEHLERQIADPALRRALTPDYPVGGKRLLISDDYYPALARENVEVVTDPIDRVTTNAVVTADGRTVPADVIILATGFETTTFLAPMDLEGLDGARLQDRWRGGAEAYLGMTVAGFPNLFMLYGPNTNLGHNSILFMIECQVSYALQCVRTLAERDLKFMDVRRDVMAAYNEEIQELLERSVWAKTGKSWYKRADGKITNNWSGPTIAYWWQTRQPELGFYRLEPRESAEEETVADVA